MIFKEVLEMWLKEKRNYVKESTYSLYCFEVQNYILPMMGTRSIADITEEYIQNTVWYWQQNGMENGHPLKKSTVQNLVMLIKQIFRYAAKKRLIENGNFEIHFVPQANPRQVQVFSQSEQNQLIQAVLEDFSFKSFGILLCINSGLRIGELCALKWNDIDFRKKIVHISKTLQRIYRQDAMPKTQIIITAPKTATSIRDVPLSDKVYDTIKNFPYINMEGYILSNGEHYVEPRVFRKFYTNFLKKHGIDMHHFHCLRHTFATRCIESGAEYKSVSDILGHATINTTLNMYVHPQMEEKRKCVELIRWD